MTPRRERIFAGLLVVTSASYLALGFAWGSTPDEEEYRISIVTTLLHARALADGQWAFWTSDLAFGLPTPLGQSFVWHPLMPLLAWMRPDHWVVLLLLTHLVAGAAGMMRLARLVGLGPLMAGVATSTFLLASTTQNFVLTDFWPSGFVGWTLMPWVLAGMIGLLGGPAGPLRGTRPTDTADPAEQPGSTRRAGPAEQTRSTRSAGSAKRTRRDVRRQAALLGLIGGLALVNGHPGYMLVYGVPVLAFLAAHARAAVERRGAWVLAAGLMLGIAAPLVLHLGPEVTRFVAGLERMNYDNPIRWAGLWDLFARPLPAFGDDTDWTRMMVDRGARIAFFGFPFAWLACAGVLAGPWRRAAYPGLVPAFLISLALLATPGLSRLKVLPATSLFRDPMILFGILLAAGVINRLWANGWPRVTALLIGLQIVTLGLSTWPFLARTLDPGRRQPALAFVERGPAIEWLSHHTGGRTGRVYYSVQVERLMNAGDLVDAGLWRLTPAYHGLRVVNGSYKGVSVDELSINRMLPYGSVESVAPLQEAPSSLAALGLRYVIALGDEPVAATLVRISELTTASGSRLVLYEQPDVSGAMLLPRERASQSLPVLPGCPHDRLLCRDFSGVWPDRDRSAIARVQSANGSLAVDLALPAAPGTLVVAELYRPEWTAAAGGQPLEVRSAFEGLIAVDIPAGVTHVDFRYRPALRIAATVLATLVLVAIGLLVRLTPAGART